MGLTRVLGGILLFALLHNPVQAAQNVTLAWDASPDPSVVGYYMNYGLVSGTYSSIVDLGNTTSVSIPGLVEGTTYFFSATAYDALGQRSDFSNEITYTIPGGPPIVQIRVASNRQGILTVTGQIGHTYDILATQTFTDWNVVGTVTVEASGSLEFIDPNAASFSTRFYRTLEKP
jgi:hypothetical protein